MDKWADISRRSCYSPGRDNRVGNNRTRVEVSLRRFATRLNKIGLKGQNTLEQYRALSTNRFIGGGQPTSSS